MFRKVLFPTDFSEHAEKTMECLCSLKNAGVEEIALVHIADLRPYTDWLDLESFEKWQAESRDRLEEAAAKLQKCGLNVRPVMKGGPPFLGIIEAAREESVNLIVMASHGKGYIKELLLGSTTENVLRHSPVPVLVQKLKTIEVTGKTACELISQKLFTKILYATDFSAPSMMVLKQLEDLKTAGIEEVIVLHVQDTGDLHPYFRPKVEELKKVNLGRLEDLEKELQASGLKSRIILREGKPYQEIMNVADEENVSLLVMGFIGQSMIKEALLGSVSGKVARFASQPVLLIK